MDHPSPDDVRELIRDLDMTAAEVASLLHLGTQGQRTVRRWQQPVDQAGAARIPWSAWAILCVLAGRYIPGIDKDRVPGLGDGIADLLWRCDMLRRNGPFKARPDAPSSAFIDEFTHHYILPTLDLDLYPSGNFILSIDGRMATDKNRHQVQELMEVVQSAWAKHGDVASALEARMLIRVRDIAGPVYAARSLWQ
ncbi:unnamed protein product, partial [Cyprideis torosa]